MVSYPETSHALRPEGSYFLEKFQRENEMAGSFSDYEGDGSKNLTI